MKTFIIFTLLLGVSLAFTPQKLAIFYGWPSTVNAKYSVAGAAGEFGDYDIVVFGSGLELTTHGDHDNMVDIIAHQDMANTESYGYIDATLSNSTIEDKISKWNDTGVAGIFFDQFGYDYNLDRYTQNHIVQECHDAGLKVIANAWDPDDVFDGTPAHKLNTDDWYLAESFAVKNNAYDDVDTDTDGDPDWVEKADLLVTYQDEALIMTIGTTGTSGTFTQAKADYSYYATAMYGFDAWGWGEINYSSAGGANSLPFRTRKSLPEGTKRHGSLTKTGDIIEHNTNVGFHLDTDGHTVSDRLD